MANITMAVPDETLERFRAFAMQRGRTVNALVREFMDEVTGRDDAVRQASALRLRALAARTEPAEQVPVLSRNQIWDRQDR